jgi:colanic acid/amylovoran biosynthesis glycosyltransferase
MISICGRRPAPGQAGTDPREDGALAGSMVAARPLCLLLPEVGVVSETFIRSDVQDLLSGRVTVISDPPPQGQTVVGPPAWDTAGAPHLAFKPVPTDPLPSADRMSQVERFIRDHRASVVLIEYLDFAVRWFDLLRPLGPQVWLRGHGVDLSVRLRDPHWIDAYRRYAAADGVIVPSHAAACSLAALGLPRDRVHVVRYGVDVPTVLPSRARRTQRELRCAAVGRLVPKKAPLLVLESFRLAARHDRRLRLDLVGDGPLMPAVRRFVTDHRLEGVVRVHGRLTHPAALAVIRHAGVLLHHAVVAPDGDAEGQPLAVLEAMAAGLVVIATDHQGIPEVITGGVDGVLVPPGDVAAMAEALANMAADPALRADLGMAARRRIRQGHTREQARQTMLSLLGLTEERRDHLDGLGGP